MKNAFRRVVKLWCRKDQNLSYTSAGETNLRNVLFLASIRRDYSFARFRTLRENLRGSLARNDLISEAMMAGQDIQRREILRLMAMAAAASHFRRHVVC